MTKKEKRAAIVQESNATGKCFEDLLAEKSLSRYAALQKRLADIAREYFVKVMAKRSVGDYVDSVHKRLAMSVADQMALDAEYEKRWDKIRENLRAEGAHGEER